jgi:quercetin dioxygenase-like cupin family protein
MERTNMKALTATIATLCLIVSASALTQPALTQAESGSDALLASSQTLDIKRNGSQPSRSGPAEYFTGSVRVHPLFPANEPSRTSGGAVTFEPGARSAWHTHPLGQTLVVTAGAGRVQRWGGPIEEIRPGDVIWTPPGVKHWHGAAPTTAMTHIAIQEALNSKNVDWMEKVSDEQYRADR